jgi:hypothetical protein
MDLVLIDPGLLLRAEVLDDSRPLYDQRRREAPVWRIPDQDSYLDVDPALIRDAAVRTGKFSSNLVRVLHRVKGPKTRRTEFCECVTGRTQAVSSKDCPGVVITLGAWSRPQRLASGGAVLSGLPTSTRGQAARSYSWMSPLRMSRRATASPLGVTR